MHLLLTAFLIGNPYTVVEPNPYSVQIVQPQSAPEWLILWPDGSWCRESNLHKIADFAGLVLVCEPNANGRLTVHAHLQSPTRQQIETTLAKAKAGLQPERKVSRTARPKERWPLLSAGELVDPDLTRRGPWPITLEFPSDMERYIRAEFTQRLFNRTQTERVRRLDTPKKWHQSGGMEGVEEFRSDLYRYLPAEPKVWLGDITVSNGGDITHYNQFGRITNVEVGAATQTERGYKVLFPDGTKFMDVLSNGGDVFEVRQREKREGKWQSAILFEDVKARPKGYMGLTVSCNSCHSQAGTGGYATGLVPGGDGVLSVGFKTLER